MAPPTYRRKRLADATPAHSAYSIKGSSYSEAGSFHHPPSPAHSVASAATDDTFSSMHKPAERNGEAVSHPVAMSDRQLYKIAAQTGRSIDWDTMARSAQSETARWKWQENSRDFAIYVRQTSESYAVFATGVVPCSVSELVTVLDATNAKQHLQKMGAFHGGQFKGGAHVYTVDLTSDHMRQTIASCGDHGTPISNLMVKTATFTKTNWLHRNEEWCYLAVMRRHPNNERFEKQMTSLAPKDLVAGKSDGRTKFLHDMVSAVLFLPEEADEAEAAQRYPKSMGIQGKPVQLTRVHFFAEYTPQSQLFQVPLGSNALASDKTVRQRILKMAQGSERFTQLIRRHRLGVQVLVDQMRVLPPTNTACFCCNSSQLLAKLCRVCGQGVCASCSDKHEREVQVRGGTRARLDDVRVCDRCMARVDTCNYENVTDRSLMGPVVFPNAKDDKSATESLKELLQQALMNAPSRELQASVMNVIKCVVDDAPESRSVDDYMTALDTLHVPQVAHHQAEISASSGRAYVMDTSHADRTTQYPVPANEADRLRAIHSLNALGIGHSDELDIICSLAAKELDSLASLVAIVTNTDKHVIGANVPSLENARFARSHAFCSHTIMDDKPLVVPHPEADVRFHQSGLVQETGVRYYCGFPLVAEDNKTVIGALCCVDDKTHDITESQYAALRKLAQTASKVVRIQGKQRRESAARGHRTPSVQYAQL